MAGRSLSKTGVNALMPGHPRLTSSDGPTKASVGWASAPKRHAHAFVRRTCVGFALLSPPYEPRARNRFKDYIHINVIAQSIPAPKSHRTFRASCSTKGVFMGRLERGAGCGARARDS
jgi:hypothetical protein